MLNDRAQVGPQTYTSISGTVLVPLTNDGRNIVPHISGFRDPRFLHVGDRYYYSYTAGHHHSPSIGLIYSTDLQNWVPVATPDWSELTIGHENAVWNGSWWNDNGAYYMFFGTCERATTLCTPFVVPFDPATATFGRPQAISFTTRPYYHYAIVMSVFQSAGTNWALLQTRGPTGNSVVALASFASLSSPWVTNWQMLGKQPSHKESGAAIVLPNGEPRVYYVQTGGGELLYTTASDEDPSTATWSPPQAIPPFQRKYQPADWVDVVQISDPTAIETIARLRGANSGAAAN